MGTYNLSFLLKIFSGLFLTVIYGKFPRDSQPDLNILESILRQQYLFAKKRPYAKSILFNLCETDLRLPKRISLVNSNDVHKPKIDGTLLGATLSEDIPMQTTLLDFVVVFDSTTQSTSEAIDELNGKIQTVLFIDTMQYAASSICEIMDTHDIMDRLVSYAFSCKYSIIQTNQLNITKNNYILGVEFLINTNNINWKMILHDEWFPFCKSNANTFLSKYLIKNNITTHHTPLFYHSLIGCTKPLMNIDKLEAQWPGIMKQWIMHHIYLMGMGYLSIYDIDGSAWEYVKEFIELGLIRYYGLFALQNVGKNSPVYHEYLNSRHNDNNGEIKIILDDPIYNFMANTHCVWDNKGKTEWLIILSSPSYFLNDLNIGGNQLGQYLDSHELNEVITKIEVIEHNIRLLNIRTTTTSTINKVHSQQSETEVSTSAEASFSLFGSFPFIPIHLSPAKLKLIVDPHKIATLLDGDSMVSTESATQHNTLQFFIRYYSSMLKNITIQPNTMNIVNDVIMIDNTMEKISAFYDMMEDIHNMVIPKRYKPKNANIHQDSTEDPVVDVKQDGSMNQAMPVKGPYLTVMSILDNLSSSITRWIDNLRLLGVDMFLFFILHDDTKIDILTDYIRKGIIEVHYVSEFPDYRAYHKTQFYIQISNNAITYMKDLGVTWMTILHEHDYFYERFPISGMTRNGLKYYLKQQEQRRVDMINIEGKAVIKQTEDLPVSQDRSFYEEESSRFIVRVQSSKFYENDKGEMSWSCAKQSECVIENISRTDNHMPIGFVSLSIDYAWKLEAKGIIKSANDEIAIILNDFSKHYEEIVLDPNILNNQHSLVKDAKDAEDGFDNLIMFVTAIPPMMLSMLEASNSKVEAFLRLVKSIAYPLIVYTDRETIYHIASISGGLSKHIIFLDIFTCCESVAERSLCNSGSKISKMDYVHDVYGRYRDYSYYAWIDFDYAQTESQIPKHIDISRLLPNKVMIAIKLLPKWNVLPAREEVLANDQMLPQGSSFIIPNTLVPSLQQLWQEELYHAEQYQNLIDGDRVIVYHIMLRVPHLFIYVRPFKWNALYNTYLNKELVFSLMYS